MTRYQYKQKNLKPFKTENYGFFVCLHFQIRKTHLNTVLEVGKLADSGDNSVIEQ